MKHFILIVIALLLVTATMNAGYLPTMRAGPQGTRSAMLKGPHDFTPTLVNTSPISTRSRPESMTTPSLWSREGSLLVLPRSPRSGCRHRAATLDPRVGHLEDVRPAVSEPELSRCER